MSFSAAEAEIGRCSFIMIQWTLDQIPILMTCKVYSDELARLMDLSISHLGTCLHLCAENSLVKITSFHSPEMQNNIKRKILT